MLVKSYLCKVVPEANRTDFLLPSPTLAIKAGFNHLVPADCQIVPDKHSISIRPEGAYSHLPMGL